MNLKRNMNVWIALVAASIFYSLAHFFDNGQIFIPENPTIRDAFGLLLGYLEPMTRRPMDILPEFIGLFLFGVLLNLAFVRTRSLFLSIGIHAGAVFLIKFQHSFMRKDPGDFYHPWFGTSPEYDGAFEWLILIGLAYMIWSLTGPLFARFSKR